MSVPGLLTRAIAPSSRSSLRACSAAPCVSEAYTALSARRLYATMPTERSASFASRSSLRAGDSAADTISGGRWSGGGDRRRGLATASAPLFQAKAPAKKGGGAGPAPAAVVEVFDLAKQIPVNILKEGPEPEYRADSEYPPWLFADLLEEKAPLEDLMMRGVENLKAEEMKVVIRTVNKKRIKERNQATSKSGGDE